MNRGMHFHVAQLHLPRMEALCKTETHGKAGKSLEGRDVVEL